MEAAGFIQAAQGRAQIQSAAEKARRDHPSPLAEVLREMEADSLVNRRDHGEIPPRVDYRLTSLGTSLAPFCRRWSGGRSETISRMANALQDDALTNNGSTPSSALAY
jgi:DNA-binding HxlR family transcriptional regulator